MNLSFDFLDLSFASIGAPEFGVELEGEGRVGVCVDRRCEPLIELGSRRW